MFSRCIKMLPFCDMAFLFSNSRANEDCLIMKHAMFWIICSLMWQNQPPYDTVRVDNSLSWECDFARFYETTLSTFNWLVGNP